MNFLEPPAPVVKPPPGTDSRAVAALVLGIVGIVMCPFCAPIAWAIGQTAERDIDASGGALGGRGLATAGKITGIIGTVLLILYVLAFIALFAFAGWAVNESSSLTDPVTTTTPR